MKMEKEKITIMADMREKHSGVIKALYDEGALIDIKPLPSGDFLCSGRVAVEVKRAQDFVNSIIDGRLLQQLKALKQDFERPVMIIEGATETDIYAVRNVHPNSVRGMMAAIAVSYGIPILHSKHPRDTAGLLMAIARRERDENAPEPSLHNKKPEMLHRQQEYLVASLPGIEVRLARALLQKFGSVSEIANASEEQLQKVDLIGPKKAAAIFRVMGSEYEPQKA